MHFPLIVLVLPQPAAVLTPHLSDYKCLYCFFISTCLFFLSWLSLSLVPLPCPLPPLCSPPFPQIFSFLQYNSSRPREEWEMWHPTLIAEALFAIANIFSSLRLISLFTANSHLGPLQISLGRMLLDILKFLFIYCLVRYFLLTYNSGITLHCIDFFQSLICKVV